MSEELNGYTRVTDILFAYTGYHQITPYILKKAADRGARAHDSIEAFFEGLPLSKDVDIEGYLASFIGWWDRLESNGHIDVVAVEKRLFCDELKITGKFDLIYKDKDGNQVLVDFKTSSKYSPTWELQGSAYHYLANKNGYNITKVQFVKLNAIGCPPEIYDIALDLNTFLDCHKLHEKFLAKKVFHEELLEVL